LLALVRGSHLPGRAGFYAEPNERPGPSYAGKYVVLSPTDYPPKGLVVSKGGTDQGFFVLSCDKDWNVVADSWHLTLDEALAEAERLYPGCRDRWQPGG